MLVSVRDLVDADLYPDEESVVRDALRSLLRTRPEMPLELAVRRYAAEEEMIAHRYQSPALPTLFPDPGSATRAPLRAPQQRP